MAVPKRGDVVLRHCTESDGFLILDAVTSRRLLGPVPLERAIEFARHRGSKTLWQQHIDERGRPLGPPSRLALV